MTLLHVHMGIDPFDPSKPVQTLTQHEAPFSTHDVEVSHGVYVYEEQFWVVWSDNVANDWSETLPTRSLAFGFYALLLDALDRGAAGAEVQAFVEAWRTLCRDLNGPAPAAATPAAPPSGEVEEDEEEYSPSLRERAQAAKDAIGWAPMPDRDGDTEFATGVLRLADVVVNLARRVEVLEGRTEALRPRPPRSRG